MSPAPNTTIFATASRPDDDGELVERVIVQQRDESRERSLTVREVLGGIDIEQIGPAAAWIVEMRQCVEREPPATERGEIAERVADVRRPFFLRGVLLHVEDP